MMTACRLFAFVLLISSSCCPAHSAAPSIHSTLAQYEFRRPAKTVRLPKYLREVSGLASIGATQVLLHDDNESDLYVLELGAAAGQPLTYASQGESIHGDFEGVALVDRLPVLADSQGILYAFRGDHPQPQKLVPHWHGRCGFEGLAYEAKSRLFFVPCKYPNAVAPGFITIHRYQLTPTWRDGSTAPELAPLVINVARILQVLHLQRLRPSAIETLANGHLLILAGKERVLLETDRDGHCLAWRRLGRFRHRQAEGIAMLANGDLVIADEGRWFGGLISVYHRQRTAR